MPIKYQMLGGGGSVNTLVLTTNPNTKVILSGERYTNTLTTDESGNVAFKHLKEGTYTATVEIDETHRFSREFLIKDVFNEDIGKAIPIKDVPLREHLMFSSGKSFTIMAKNLQYHQSNSVTLTNDLCYDITDRYGGAEDYERSFDKSTNKYFNELSQKEKESLILHKYQNMTDYSPQTFKEKESYFYVPSCAEISKSWTQNEKNGVSIGYESDREKIKYRAGNNGQLLTASYWTRTLTDGAGYRFYINDSGTQTNTSYNTTHYVAPLCDVKGDTLVAKDVDGYWKIV